MTPIRAVITGVSGRMGALLVRLVRDTPEFILHAGTDKPGHATIGLDVGLAAHVAPLEVSTVDSLASVLGRAHVVIDFTTPEASVAHARACAEARVPLVVGSTGFHDDAKAAMEEASRHIPLVMAPNMSVGVNLVIELAALLAQRLGEGFDIEVLEAHHRHKKDAPSGTAMRLAEELAAALGRDAGDIRTARVGQVGERPRHEIGVQTLRGGDVVGEHTVYFFGDGERIELTHRATSREQFGRGALRAAKWLIGKPPGLYDMTHVLGALVTRYARVAHEGRAAYARVSADGQWLDVLDGAPWEESTQPTSLRIPWASATWLPVTDASKVVAIGQNYRKHAQEMGKPVPAEPLIFLKPSTALNAHQANIVLPAASAEVHYEAELALVIGKQLTRASVAESAAGIFALTCFNDVTARDIQRREVQHTRAKSYDTFACCGPMMVTQVSAEDLRVVCRVNGVVRQDERTADMVHRPAALVSFISQAMTLLPGDLISTGTPSGVGPLAHGDVVEVEIEQVGTLRNVAVRA